MTIAFVRRSLASVALAASLLMVSGAASAVVYSSVFDPPNFNGTATFDVSQACLDAGPGFFAPSSVSGCSVSWLSALVNFTDPTGTTTLYSFSYALSQLAATMINMIFIDSAGDLAGVSSDAVGPHIIGDSPGGIFDGPWWIQFAFSPPSNDFTALDGPQVPGSFGFGVVYLYTGTCDGRSCDRNDQPSEVAQVEGFTRVTQVVEPGTAALALAAAWAAWFARRRRAA